MTDSELVSRIIARDRSALSIFYRAHTPKLRQYIAQKVQNVADADEILQDTLFAFLEAIRDFQGTSRLQTFLYAICQHKIIDFYRKKKIKHVVFSQAPFLESIVSPLLGPEDAYETQLLKDKIHYVFSKLLPQYREALILKYAERVPVAEIARRFAVTMKSAESQLSRARKAFIEIFISI